MAFVDGNCICMKSRASGRHLAVSASGNMVTGVGSPTDENCKLLNHPSKQIEICDFFTSKVLCANNN